MIATTPDLTDRQPLTDRQKQILLLSAHGLDNQEVGRAMGLAAGTVRNARSEILEQLGAVNLVHAFYLALKAGEIAIT